MFCLNRVLAESYSERCDFSSEDESVKSFFEGFIDIFKVLGTNFVELIDTLYSVLDYLSNCDDL